MRQAGWLARKLKKLFSRGDEHGQGLAEYGLILAFVALVAIAALGVMGDAIANSPGFDLFQ
mgnify:CR=1 FL=1